MCEKRPFSATSFMQYIQRMDRAIEVTKDVIDLLQLHSPNTDPAILHRLILDQPKSKKDICQEQQHCLRPLI